MQPATRPPASRPASEWETDRSAGQDSGAEACATDPGLRSVVANPWAGYRFRAWALAASLRQPLLLAMSRHLDRVAQADRARRAWRGTDSEQVYAPDDLVQRTRADRGQVLARFLRDIEQKSHHPFGNLREFCAQLLALRRNTD